MKAPPASLINTSCATLIYVDDLLTYIYGAWLAESAISTNHTPEIWVNLVAETVDIIEIVSGSRGAALQAI